jgi:hypothetical protein
MEESLYTEVTECQLFEYDFTRNEEVLRRQGRLCLYLEAGEAEWDDFSHEMAYAEFGANDWTVVDFKNKRYLLLYRDSAYVLIDLKNVTHYGLLRFAEKPSDNTARVDPDFHQETIAMLRLLELFL